MKRKPGDTCPYCLRLLTVSVFTEKERLRRSRIKAALKNNELAGRPRTINYDDVKRLRAEGLSLSQIAAKLSTSTRTVSLGAVQNGIRIK